MNTYNDKKRDDEIIEDTDDDDDTRSEVSTDSITSKDTNTTHSSENYTEDFDNKSEKEVENEPMEEVTDEMLFNTTPEPEKEDIEIEDTNDNNEEEKDVEVIDNSPIVDAESSLLIQYEMEDNNTPTLSIPYGIYKECYTNEDGKSVCKETDLSNIIDEPEIVPPVELNERTNSYIEEEVVEPDVVNKVIEEEVVEPDVVNKVIEEEVIEPDVVNKVIEEEVDEEEKINPIKRKVQGTKKKHHTRKFLHTKKKRGYGRYGVSKKKMTRNKRSKKRIK